MEQLEVGGLRIAYERAGDGLPLLLLHGYVGDGPTTWRTQIDELADEFTVIAWDAPGAGGSSDPPDETFGMVDYADCLAGFVRELGLSRPPCVAGLSFGGALGIELYRRHPEIPAKLVLAGAYAGWAGSLPSEEVERRSRQAVELAELSPREFVDALLPTMFSEGTPQEVIEGFRAAMLDFHPAGFRAMARASAEDLSDVLPQIGVPTLLLYGDDDVRATGNVAEEIHAAIPDSTLVFLEGAGHLCNVEAPEEFNRQTRAFLRNGST